MSVLDEKNKIPDKALQGLRSISNSLLPLGGSSKITNFGYLSYIIKGGRMQNSWTGHNLP